MILSKRERIVVVLTLAALSILVLDRYVLSPFLASYSAAGARREKLWVELRQAENLLARRRRIDPRWREMLSGSLKRDPAEAESQMFHALLDWSEQAGLKLSLRPERSAEKTDLREITFHITTDGSMKSVLQFLWRLKTADIPTKLESVRLRSRKDGIDDLELQLRVSTLYLAAPSASPQAGDRVVSKGGVR